jgi:putative ABC transport system permease protein
MYRLAMKGDMSGFSFESAVMGGPLGSIMHEEIPEIIKHTTFYHMPRPVLIEKGENRIYQEHVLFVDTCFFKIFGYEIIAGDPATMLCEPYSMVLTSSMARKLFGNEDPLGKQVKWNNQSEYTVTGIIMDSRYNSHMNFEVAASFGSLLEQEIYNNLLTTLYAFVTYNYVVLDKTAAIDTVERKINEVIQKYMGESMQSTGSHFEIFLQPVRSIHLQSDLVHELEPNSSITRVYIFAAISLLILIIACINYINLTVARSSQRALEIGIRKIFGAERKDLFIQFMAESLLITLLSLLIAVLLFELLLPGFNNFSGIDPLKSIFNRGTFYLGLTGLIIVVGLISGIYPAVYLSGIKSISVLKGITVSGRSGSAFRSIMVIFQLMTSIFLIFATFIIHNQLVIINSKDMGVDRKNLIVIPLRSTEMTRSIEYLKNEMTALPDVEDVTFFSSYLGSFEQRRGFFMDETQRNDLWMIHHIQVSQNYLDVMKIRLLQGRNFRYGSRADSNAVIINKALADQAGWKDPVGKMVIMPADEQELRYEVIGMTDNFNYASIHSAIESLLIFLDPQKTRYMGIRVREKEMTMTISLTGEKWNKLFPDYPFDYFIQEDFYRELYREEMKMGELFIYFAILAVLIASMGLFGLILFTTARRFREIGIRKALGGSAGHITWLLLKELIIWTGIASVIGWCLAYLFTREWTQNFIYKAPISWWIFLLASAIVLLISLLTTGYQTVRAATSDPVKALRYE